MSISLENNTPQWKGNLKGITANIQYINTYIIWNYTCLPLVNTTGVSRVKDHWGALERFFFSLSPTESKVYFVSLLDITSFDTAPHPWMQASTTALTRS